MPNVTYVPSSVGEGHFTDFQAPASGATDNGKVWAWNSTTSKFEPITPSGGTPGGSSTHVQWNNGAGGFGGDSGFVYSGSGVATLTGRLVVPVIRPPSDSATAVMFQTTAGNNVLSLNTTNRIVVANRLTVSPSTNDIAVMVAPSSGATVDTVQIYNPGGNKALSLSYDDTLTSIGKINALQVNATPGMNRTIGAGKRYTVTFTNCTLGQADALFSGLHSGAPMRCNAGVTGSVEVDFNPFIGWTANTNTGYTYPRGLIYISFWSGSEASTITIEMYRPGGGVDAWATVATVTGNTASSRVIEIGAVANYIKKLRISVTNPSKATWVSGIDYFPLSPESSAEMQFVPKHSNDTIALYCNTLDIVGALRADSLRIDQSPTAETVTCTHTITISANGANYKIPCVAA